MKIIFIAMLMATGVMFGTMALVLDLGFDMGQQGAMQNAADAGALAGARLLASSVGSTNPINYVVSDNDVHNAVVQFATYNRVLPTPPPNPTPGPFLSATYETAVEYLPWNGSTCVSRNADGTIYRTGTYTAQSTAALVATLGGTVNTLPASQLGSVPSNTCGLRVWVRMTHSGMFALAGCAATPTPVPTPGPTPTPCPVGARQEQESASAAARVFSAPPPTTFSNVWPITRWLGAPGCSFALNSPPCTFWDSQGPPNGPFKLMVDLSRYSNLVYPNPLRPQHIDDYDHIYPGNSTNRQTDLGNWLRNGWNGQLNVADSRCSVNNTAILQFANCTNSRLEVYNGTLGSNVGDNMRTFIAAHAEGVDTSSMNLGRFVTMHVFLWRYGEADIDTSTDVASTLWTSGSSASIQRVILDQVRCFRFFEQTVSNSQANGYYVSCPSNSPPTGGGPSTIANTIGFID